MKMGTDAQGFLHSIIPIVLRMNVYIINIDTSNNAKNSNNNIDKYNINDYKSSYEDIKLWIND